MGTNRQANNKQGKDLDGSVIAYPLSPIKTDSPDRAGLRSRKIVATTTKLKSKINTMSLEDS